ncbi:aldehyde dehydrogenase family protein [Mucilaginibacter lacusdianchii]|uniref:aldehyde dehydrogenase family protein n=1 Tax=Mucilaginibacter lacusdianchii TaxID=2684211 RepID=UPI0018EECD8F|nr:aldehyde dehydrogenase family protein [Mucilaginibacter sp. JXJ CY 39]
MQFINSEWREGSDEGQIENLNPFDNNLINTFKAAGKDDVDAAYDCAKEASKTWSKTNPLIRRDLMLRAADIIMKRKDEIADWLIKEAGGTALKAQVEIKQSYDMLIEASGYPTRMHGFTIPSFTDGKETYVYRKALGVVSMISPWNFPLYLSMRTIAPAIAVGNAIVIKPASQSPVTGGTIIAKIFEEAGIPKGVINCVVGKSAVIGDYFTGHPASRLISFTGSTPVGKGIGRIGGEALKKLALELGGNNAFIILDDADVDRAVDSAIFGRFMHQGQICMSTNRILVHDSIYDEFRDKFVAKAKTLAYGDPAKQETIIGPLIDNKAVQHVLNLIEKSVGAGAKLETGGKAEGNVVQPTVLSEVTKDMAIFQEEVFGPAVGLVRFKTDEEAIELANGTEYGLSGALHTRNLQRGIEIAKQVETGMIHINDQSVNDEMNTPFGGEKNSGVGRFGNDFIVDELTTVQWVSVQMQPRKYPF